MIFYLLVPALPIHFLSFFLFVPHNFLPYISCSTQTFSHISSFYLIIFYFIFPALPQHFSTKFSLLPYNFLPHFCRSTPTFPQKSPTSKLGSNLRNNPHVKTDLLPGKLYVLLLLYYLCCS